MNLHTELETKRTQYRSKWESYGTKTLADGQVVKDIPANDIEGLRLMMKEINDLAAKAEADHSRQVDLTPGWTQEIPVNRVSAKAANQSLSDAFLNSAAWRGRVGGTFGDVELAGKAAEFFETKATMTTAAGFAPMSFRDGTVVPAIARPPQLIDFLRVELTEQNAIKYMKQSTRTNAAASKAEGAALDEATLAYAESTIPIRRIGVFLPVTEEQLEDEPSVRALIENDLRMMVRQKLDEQVTVGDGTGVNILGLNAQTGALSQARGSDDEFDQILKAMTKARSSGRARPNLVVLHSSNYQRLGLTKTADGIYIFGNPADEPLQRVWGVQIVQSDALPAGSGLVLDSDFVRIKLRKDLTIASTDSHAGNFASNMVAIRAHIRAGLQVLRDEAICKLSDLRA